jgi:hypothetical protein
MLVTVVKTNKEAVLFFTALRETFLGGSENRFLVPFNYTRKIQRSRIIIQKNDRNNMTKK